MAGDSDLEKTEPASERRKQQARDEGNVPHSKELSSFLMLMSGVTGLWVSTGWLYEHFGSLMRHGLTIQRHQVLDTTSMQQILGNLFGSALIAVTPLLGVLIVTALATPALMGGYIFSPKAFQLNLERLNPLSGLGRMFSLHGLVELVKGILKSILIGGVGAWVLWHSREEIFSLLGQSLEDGLGHFAHMLLFSALMLTASLGFLACIDVPFQLWQYYDKLKMSKEELRQEHKEQEGDPQIKSRIRSKQREMARRRMMEAVPKADVVVTNPTHYAVALKYDAERMSAPTVVAKGADHLAHTLRELAQQHNVPILEAPPLARALYRHAEIGQQVPAALYTAVAEVMAYVYQLGDALETGDEIPVAPTSLPVPEGMDPGLQAQV